MSSNISTIITFAGALLVIEAIVMGALLSKVGEFLVKLAFAALIFTIAIASKSAWLSEILSGSLWLATVAAAAAIVVVILIDLRRLVKHLEHIEARRRYHRGSRRTTPARH